jgi:hypothetical protein
MKGKSGTIEINNLQVLDDLTTDIRQLWVDLKAKHDFYNILLEEFYKNIDNQSKLPPHLRMIRD